ncbi:MAG: FecR domain-containing protein [Terricaulis sp.]
MTDKPSRAEIEASRWIARLEADNVSLNDHRSFRRWLESRPENRLAYEDIARTWDKLDLLKFLHEPPPPTTARHSRRGLLIGATSVAAIAVLAVAAAPTLQDAGAKAYRTRIGERQSDSLSDGSQVRLNADTEIRVRIDAYARQVRLARGEALFEIQSDPARPFIVSTPFGEVRTYAGTFSIKLRGGYARATIVSGSIEGIGIRSSLPFNTQAQSIQVETDQELVLGSNRLRSETTDAARVARRLAWQDGMLAFDSETLRDAADDVAAQTGARFRFANEATANRRVSGYIRGNDLNAFVSLAQINLGLRVQQTPSFVLLGP